MRVPKRLEHLWPCYRLLCEERCTWTELTETMSIDDVMDLNDVLDAWNEAGKPRTK